MQASNIPQLDHDQWRAFARDVDQLGSELSYQTGFDDFRHLRRYERWGHLATAIGYASSWIFPNPIAALFISVGTFTRWSLLLHPISHGAFDRVDGIPERYTSRGFARGVRRYLDWFDWMKPEQWDIEHNLLHHYHLGTDRDPDIVERNTKALRELRLPRSLRMTLAFLVACTWKPLYYAPNTLIEARHYLKRTSSNRITAGTWSLRTPEGRELWFGCLLPYALLRFALIPAMFLAIGSAAAVNVLLTTLMAEALTNLHGFLMIGPNHTGDDVAVFQGSAANRGEFYFRQITGSINFPAGSALGDFLYGGLNYQIEHHVFPKATLLQCQRAQPHLKAICERYSVPYKEAPLLARARVVFRTIVGKESAK